MIRSATLLIFLLVLFLTTVSFAFLHEYRDSDTFQPLTRAEMIVVAERLANHTWTCGETNTVADCEQTVPYTSDFRSGQTYTGIAYDWGGMDNDSNFDNKLANGQAAGSHSKHGSTTCTAGIDCSGFVGLTWGITDRKLSTTQFDTMFVQPDIDIYTELQPGDALNKAGRHIMLFAGYAANGEPLVYEANASRFRVVYQQRRWSSLTGYKVIRYPNLVE